MIACCIPMLVIAIVLVATGVLGAGFILVAVMCTAMMGMSGRFSTMVKAKVSKLLDRAEDPAVFNEVARAA